MKKISGNLQRSVSSSSMDQKNNKEASDKSIDHQKFIMGFSKSIDLRLGKKIISNRKVTPLDYYATNKKAYIADQIRRFSKTPVTLDSFRKPSKFRDASVSTGTPQPVNFICNSNAKLNTFINLYFEIF